MVRSARFGCEEAIRRFQLVLKAGYGEHLRTTRAQASGEALLRQVLRLHYILYVQCQPALLSLRSNRFEDAFFIQEIIEIATSMPIAFSPNRSLA